MAKTITVSKKRPLSLKSPTEEAAPAEAAGPDLAAAPGMPSVAREPSYTLYGITAIIAVLCFVLLVLLQWMEVQYYDAPTPVFARPGLSITS